MKAVEEITKELIDVARWNGVYNGEYQIFSNEVLKEFEQEIRKDQVNKCAGSIIGIPKESIHKKEVVLAIMGTIEDK